MHKMTIICPSTPWPYVMWGIVVICQQWGLPLLHLPCFILLLITRLLCLICQLEHAKYFIKTRCIISLHTEWSYDFRIQERLNLNNDSQYKVSSLSVSLEHFIGLCREFDGFAKVTGTSAVFHVKEIMEGRPLLCHGVCGSQHFKDHIAYRMLVDTHSITWHYILQKVNLQQHPCENLKICTYM